LGAAAARRSRAHRSAYRARIHGRTSHGRRSAPRRRVGPGHHCLYARLSRRRRRRGKHASPIRRGHRPGFRRSRLCASRHVSRERNRRRLHGALCRAGNAGERYDRSSARGSSAVGHRPRHGSQRAHGRLARAAPLEDQRAAAPRRRGSHVPRADRMGQVQARDLDWCRNFASSGGADRRVAVRTALASTDCDRATRKPRADEPGCARREAFVLGLGRGPRQGLRCAISSSPCIPPIAKTWGGPRGTRSQRAKSSTSSIV